MANFVCGVTPGLRTHMCFSIANFHEIICTESAEMQLHVKTMLSHSQAATRPVVLNLFKGAEPQEKSMTTHRTPQVWLIIFK